MAGRILLDDETDVTQNCKFCNDRSVHEQGKSNFEIMQHERLTLAQNQCNFNRLF